MACCETLLGRKVQGVKRNPGTEEERADNIEAVLHELTDNILQTDLSHISGRRVVSGDPVDVHSLLEILAALLTGDADYQTTGRLEPMPSKSSNPLYSCRPVQLQATDCCLPWTAS